MLTTVRRDSDGSIHRTSLRILALGNDILGDDAFAFLVAQRVRERIPGVEVTCSSASGFHLLDDLLGVERLLVVDTVMTGTAPPGTVYVVREGDLEVTPAIPHTTPVFSRPCPWRAPCI